MGIYDLFYDRYNYTDFHELNLSWLLKKMIELNETVKNFVSLNTIKYADPIQWNITSQYEVNTVVVDPQTGTAYLSVQPVPTGIGITNTDYWTVIFTLDVISANKNITLRDDGSNVLATFTSNVGDWLLWNGTLYRVSQSINVNEAYVVGYNLDRYTIEMFIVDYINAITNIIGSLSDLNTTDKDSVVDAINEVLDIIGNLSDLNTTDKDSVVDAINEVLADLDDASIYDISKHGAIADGVTDNTAIIQAGINSGKPVYIPEGTWATHQIECKYSTVIFGKTDGYGNSGTGGSVLKSLDASGCVIHIPALMHKVIIKDIAINGNAVDNTGVNGIEIEHTASEFFITGVYIHKCAHGIKCGSTGWATIQKCMVEQCYRDGYHFENGTTGATRPLQINIINCLAEYNNGSGYRYINNSSNGPAPAGTILNCSSFANSGYGIIFGGTGGYGFSAIRMNNCFFGSDNLAEMLLSGNMQNYTASISNTQFELAGVEDNGVGLSNPASHNAFGIVMETNAAAMFSNCLFASNSNAAVYLSGAKAEIGNSMFRSSCVYHGLSEVISDLPSRLNIANCRFIGNAGIRGVQLYNADDWLTAIGNTFETTDNTTSIVTLSTNTKIHKSMNVKSDGDLIT